MNRQCTGNGLMRAGVIVSLVGVMIAASVALEIPGYWIPVIVGVILFLAGATMAVRRQHG